ncbi:MAG: MgtC/SapB family protein [Capsulimonadaceae bacterium]|nr:MgtC/SapB family protein [Capsulimonadaceae bacterium]
MGFHSFWHTIGYALTGALGHFDAQVLVRLVLTFILCGAVGLERSNHERASGLRTHILVGLGACLITMAGAYGFAGMWQDRNPMVLATYVVSGIGFLGAGAILRHGTSIRGLTTAATLWGSAGVGIAVGAGLGAMAIATVVLVLFTLVPLKRWEARLRSKLDAGDLAIHLVDEREAVGKTLTALGRLGVLVQRATVTPGAGDTAVLRVDLVRAMRPEQVPPLVEKLIALKYVTRVDTTDLNLNTEDEESETDADAVDVVEYDVPQEETPNGEDGANAADVGVSPLIPQSDEKTKS